MIDPALANEPFCYIRTTGRVTSRPHEIEIWFALNDTTIYILAGGRHDADWVKNIKRQPAVAVRIGAQTFDGTARIVDAADEDALARRVVLAKYTFQRRVDTLNPGAHLMPNDELDEWGRTALPVAIDLQARV